MKPTLIKFGYDSWLLRRMQLWVTNPTELPLTNKFLYLITYLLNMRLIEFTARWSGNYTKEQEHTYGLMYGDDKEQWPPTQDEGPIVLDLERVCRFNPHHDDDKTTVEIAGGMSFCVCIEYDRFKKLIEYATGVKIVNP